MFLGEAEGIIRSCSISGCSYNGIAVSTDGRISIEHCSIFDNQWDGVSVKSSKSVCVFYNNKIYHNKGYGIYYASSSNPKKQVSSIAATLNTANNLNSTNTTSSSSSSAAGAEQKVEADNTIYENVKGSKNF